MLNEAEKRIHSFYCRLCKIITFLDFEESAKECAIVFLERQQSVIKLQQ